jgi:hypothetical protein
VPDPDFSALSVDIEIGVFIQWNAFVSHDNGILPLNFVSAKYLPFEEIEMPQTQPRLLGSSGMPMQPEPIAECDLVTANFRVRLD